MKMSVCRTCLSTYDLQPLFPDHNAFNFSSTELFLATGVEIHKNDGISQSICINCHNLIKNALKLRELSSKANVTLRSQLTEQKVTVKIEKIGDLECKVKSKKVKKPGQMVETLTDDSPNITIDYDLLMDTNRKRNEIKIESKNYVHRNVISKTNIKNKTNTQTNSKITISECSTNNTDLNRHSKRPLRIEDLESSDSEKGSRIRIEDYESSDSFETNMSLLTEEVNAKHSVFNMHMLGKRGVLMDEKKYFDYYKHATEKQRKQKERRNMLVKERENKYLALAVTPYDRNGPVQCRVCYKSVGTLNSFKTHAKTHFDPQFSCETCGKKFQSNSHMRYHQQRMHGRTKRLACTYCSYRSVDRQTLRNHERAEHTGERPYTCDECGVSFRMRNNLIQHLRKHFGVKNMQCERCPAMFRSRSELWGHQTKVHFMTYNYFCYLCPESYKGPGPVRKHLLNVHGVPEDQQLKIKCVKTRKIREDRSVATNPQNAT